MASRITGGCLCGAVRYELVGEPVWAHSCHCSRCRKSCGGGFASNVFYPVEALRYLEGEEQRASYVLPEADHFTHVFCPRCGSSLPFASRESSLVGVPMGTLDGDPGMAPRAHIFVGSKAEWDEIADDLPRYSEGLNSPED